MTTNEKKTRTYKFLAHEYTFEERDPLCRHGVDESNFCEKCKKAEDDKRWRKYLSRNVRGNEAEIYGDV